MAFPSYISGLTMFVGLPFIKFITFSNAFKRRIIDIIDIFFYGIPALICICNTPKYQRLGDLFADTLVVKKSDIVETEVVF